MSLVFCDQITYKLEKCKKIRKTSVVPPVFYKNGKECRGTRRLGFICVMSISTEQIFLFPNNFSSLLFKVYPGAIKKRAGS